MTKVLQRVDATLRSFYIFNSQFGRREGEEQKKILYYYPGDIELNTKIKDVGLSEAIIAFADSFTDEENACKALHTQKTTQIFYRAEPDYWMVLVINVPKEIRTKDGIEVAEYRGTEVHDRIYRSVLEQCYSMFRLFAGRLHKDLANATDINETNVALYEQLQQQLTSFYDKYLLSLKLPACDIVDVTRSIQYLPLDKFLFLRAHNFVNMICSTFPAIAEAMFLYNEQVVCSGKMHPQDLFSLHEYIVGTLLTKVTHAEQGGAVLMRTNSGTMQPYRNGAFIAGPENDNDNDNANIIAPPKVYLSRENSETLESFYLIIYRALNATMCLFVRSSDDDKPDEDFYTELHSYMGPQLTSIAREISESLAKQQQTKQTATSTGKTHLASVPAATGDAAGKEPIAPKYLFINEQSLKHMSNISMDKRLPKAVQGIPTNIMHLIADLYNNAYDGHATEGADNDSDGPSSPSSFEEVQLKTTNDFWIIKRRCNWRQYFVIIFNSKATLLDVTLEAKRIFDQELTDDVFFDK